ncbi:MAG: HAD family hydrolase [Gammaproteobacteria bacterium HGW-Gammaproteobacteria-14]|nr:MAG: HAD family hydrolase [Gammaproteobacteria bacterium HGW-Gammaproteobacteria-14]
MSLRAKARRLTLMAFDVDGVLTDGRLYYGADGEQLKVFHTLDGHGLKMIAAAGITVALITGRRSDMVSKRAAELGIAHVIQGREDKGAALSALAAELGMGLDTCGYAGDDLPDVSAMQIAALRFSVPNGHPLAQREADFLCRQKGGEGAVRNICDYLLGARGLLHDATDTEASQ